MLRHVVLIRLTEDATEADVSAIVEGLGALPAVVPEIVSYSIGRDAGLVDGNFDLAIVGEFADAEGYESYATNADHLEVINTYIKPFIADRSAVQYMVS